MGSRQFTAGAFTESTLHGCWTLASAVDGVLKHRSQSHLNAVTTASVALRPRLPIISQYTVDRYQTTHVAPLVHYIDSTYIKGEPPHIHDASLDKFSQLFTLEVTDKLVFIYRVQ